MVKLAKTPKKEVKATPAKKKAPPPKQVEESSEEDSEEDDEEEEAPPPKVTAKKSATPAKAVKNGKATAKQESEEDSDDDEESEVEIPAPKKAAKATPAKGAKGAAKATPAKGAKATPAKATPVKKEESEEEEDDDDDDDDDESEEEEVPPPKKATPAKPAAKAAPAKAAAKEESEEEEEDDEEDDDDDEEEDEEMDTTPAPAKKAAAAKAEEEDDDDDDDEDDEEEEDEAPVTPGKRKADGKEKGTPPTKKAKADGEAFSLFMGNLNSENTYEEIKEAASKFFKKESLDIQDVRLGGSKKFGYVDFSCEEDLQKALALNGKKFLGLPIKLDRAKSKEDSQESKKERDARTLFVKNLPYSITQDDLKEIFDQAIDIRLPMGPNGSSRGIAYLEFKTEAIAEKMLEETQGSDVQGRSIMVDFTGAKSRQGGGAKGSTTGSAKVLVVNNLAFSATEDSLQSVFEKATAIRIPQNNGRPKGYAFVEFESTEDAKEALESCNNIDIEGRSVRLEYSQGRDGGGRGSGPTKTLFVKGLSDETTDESLRDSFDGAVAARVAMDKETGSSKGYGFVDFDNEDDCKAAKEAMDDGEIDGNRVTLDFAKPKGEGGRGGGRGGFGGGRGGRGGFGGRGGGFGGRGGGFRGGRGGFGGRGGGRGGGFRGGRGGGFGGGGPRPQGKKIKFDD